MKLDDNYYGHYATCPPLIRDLFAEHGLDEEDSSQVIITKLCWFGRTWGAAYILYHLQDQPVIVELRWKMSWKRAEAEMRYCRAALEGIGKLNGYISVEWLCGLCVGCSFAFLLGFRKEMEKAHEKS